MADEGYGQFGGGGSVHWEVDYDRGEDATKRTNGKPRGRTYSGKARDDEPNEEGRLFLVEIDKADIYAMGTTARKLVVAVNIGNPKQIKVRWAFDQTEADRELDGSTPMSIT